MSLADKVRRHLKETWQSEDRKALIQDYIDEGQAFLERYCPDIDWENDMQAIALLKNYVMYADNNGLDDFAVNYRRELISLSNRGKVAAYAKKNADSDPVV